MMTMRLFAEEKRTGTIELLATSPIRDTEIIIGKWLAALLLYAVLLLFSAINFAPVPLRPIPTGSPSPSVTWACCCKPAGSCHRNVHFHADQKSDHRGRPPRSAFGLLLWILEWVSGYETATWAKVLAYCSVITHFDSFSKGVLDTKDAVFYLSVIFLGLFLYHALLGNRSGGGRK